jgi:hypothetical protein
VTKLTTKPASVAERLHARLGHVWTFAPGADAPSGIRDGPAAVGGTGPEPVTSC